MPRTHIAAVVCLACLSLACGPPPFEMPTPYTRPPASAAAAVASAASVAPRGAPRADGSRIPRAVLFGNPDRWAPKLSPDGKRIAYLAPLDGVMNVWAGPADDPAQVKPVTRDAKRGIRGYRWAFDNAHILYVQDEAGDEDWHVFAVDVASGRARDLTPGKGISARIEATSPRVPDEVVLAMNDRDPKAHDLWRVRIRTGDKKRVFENVQGLSGFVVDKALEVRLGLAELPEGGREIRELAGASPRVIARVGPDDDLTTQVLGFDATGKQLYLLDSRERDTAALVSIDWATKKATVLAEDPKADISSALVTPNEGRVQAVQSTRERRTWKAIDPAVQPDLEYLQSVGPGDIDVISRTLDDRRWMVALIADDGPVRYYRYDRRPDRKAKGPPGQATFLFSSQRALDELPLTRMHPVRIEARDGLELVSYLSLPKGLDRAGKPPQPLPMVLVVHGGPWDRDTWGYEPTHQWLADRGYAVLSVNYRGSTGFGKKFVNAGDREWGKKSHDDLIDAVEWAVASGIADRKRIAVFGMSYGGYAVLAGLTMTPETFACGVDIVGPSNLITLIDSIPPYWTPMLEMVARRVGDPRTEEGRKMLAQRSPLTHAHRIKRPLLIAQGANDPRVKRAESDRIVEAMKKAKIPVTYVVYPDEGHGFARPENERSFHAVAEVFLAQCLDGPYEPIGQDFAGASITVPAGVDEVHGVAAALSHQRK